MRKKRHVHRGPRVSTRQKATSQWAILALGFLIGLLLLAKLITVIASLGRPISSDIVSKKTYTWDSKTSFSVVIKSDNLSLLNYDPVNKKVVILKIPDDAYFQLPHNLGSWRAGSIYDLGQEESPAQGPQLLKESLAKLLGLPIDGYISIEGPDKSKSIDLVMSSLKNPLALVGFMHQIHSDLTPIEALSLFRAVSETRSDKISMLDIENSVITESQLLPDSSRVLGVDSIQLDLFIRDKMSDMEIGQEGKTVAIVNATNHPGLAALASREITNLGGNVIFTSSTDKSSSKSQVISSSKSLTAERLSQIFAPNCLQQKCTSSDSKITSSIAEITVVLGEDFYQGL